MMDGCSLWSVGANPHTKLLIIQKNDPRENFVSKVVILSWAKRETAKLNEVFTIIRFMRSMLHLPKLMQQEYAMTGDMNNDH